MISIRVFRSGSWEALPPLPYPVADACMVWLNYHYDDDDDDDNDDNDDDFDDFDDDDDAVDDDDAWLGSLYPMIVPYCPVTSGTSSSGRFLLNR